MSVLVTRPDEPGQALCRQLEDAGIHALYHPLVCFHAGEGLSQLPDLLHRSDLVIAVSRQAVLYSQQYLHQQGHAWPADIRYLAIGQKTAQLLSNFVQQTVNYPQVSDSEHFLSLPELQSPAGLRVGILRGNGGRELIAQHLAALEAQVSYCEVYRREYLPFDAELVIQDWQQSSVESIIITSEEQLSFFLSQIQGHGSLWLLNQTLFVPSERIAQYARSLGFENTVAVGSASNSDLVAALQASRE